MFFKNRLCRELGRRKEKKEKEKKRGGYRSTLAISTQVH